MLHVELPSLSSIVHLDEFGKIVQNDYDNCTIVMCDYMHIAQKR